MGGGGQLPKDLRSRFLVGGRLQHPDSKDDIWEQSWTFGP